MFFPLKDDLLLLRKERKAVKRKLENIPPGSLMITKGKLGYEYMLVSYIDGKRVRKGISRDRNMIEQYARKAYLEEYYRRLNTNIDVLSKLEGRLLDLSPESTIQGLPAHFSLFSVRTLIGAEDIELDWPNPSADVPAKAATLDTNGLDPMVWAAMPYRVNMLNSEGKIHRTSRGLYVRSKGEVSVFELYDKKNIPYHYDEVVAINGKLVSPDGIGVRKDGSLFYHEHCGMWTDGYRENIVGKIVLYASAGIILGKNLIITHDNPDGGIDMKLIDAMLDNIYNICY